jgi:cysteinyl-tRNA synthetase
MKLYNTLTKKVADFKPLKAGHVSIYSCGPTVYDHIHIGNLSSFIYVDTLRRVLENQNYTVKQVMNFTDIDDKTIKRSLEKYPDLDAMTALNKLTSYYTKLFLSDIQSIGNDIGAVNFIKATASIKDMQNLISYLHAKGFAYVTEDGVYFSIKAYVQSGKNYGQLTTISVASTSKARIDNDEYDKESAHDFALWKVQRDGEPAWPFSLDGKDLTGRPGWHIECSAMSQKALGIPFDIHTGGIDLIFPHHENEIAQSTAGHDFNELANIFFHNEHLLVDSKKMSKSLKNFFTLEAVSF